MRVECYGDLQLWRGDAASTPGYLPINRLQCGSAYFNHHFAGRGHWLGKFFVSRKLSKRVQDGGVHRAILVARIARCVDRNGIDGYFPFPGPGCVEPDSGSGAVGGTSRCGGSG